MPIISPPVVLLSPTSQQSGAVNVAGQVEAADLRLDGLAGAQAVTRFVGGTPSGAPTTGSFLVGDFVVDHTGAAWVCTAAGSPGTWSQITGGGGSGAGVTATAALEYVLDGGGSALTTGAQGSLVVPYDCTVVACELLADQSGSLVVDIWKSAYAGYPPTSSGSIVASAPPTITSAQKSQDTTLSGWATSLIAGDILVYSITSASTITRCSVVLTVTRTISSGGGGGTTVAPYVRVANSANQTFGTGTHAIAFNTTVMDTGTTSPQHSTTTNTTRLVCQDAGTYLVGGSAFVHGGDLGVTDNNAELQISKNGTTGYAEQGIPILTQYGYATGSMAEVTDIIDLAVGDYVELWLQYSNSSGATLSVFSTGTYSSPAFWMTKLVAGGGSGGTGGGPVPAVYVGFGPDTITSLSAIPFVSARYDQGTTTPQFTVSSPTRLTCHQSGIYTITGQIDWDQDDSGTYRDIFIRLNGLNDLGSTLLPPLTTTSLNESFQVTTHRNLTAGDYIELVPFYDGLSSRTVSAHFMMALLTASGGSGGGGGTASPLTTKGDLWGYGTADARVPVGSNGQVLTADSTQALGVHWAAAGGSEAVQHNGTLVGTRPTINLIDGTGTTLTVADNSGASRVDVTIASSGGGGGGGGGGSGGATSVLLDYAATTDIISGLSCPGSTWTDLISNLTFTVGSSTSVVELAVSGAIYVGGASSLGNAGLRAIIDSGGTPILKMLGGSRLPTSGDYNNLLEGCDVVTLTGLAAGSHTVKLQVNPSVAATAHCLVATQGDQYSLQVRVLEQSSAPVWRVLRPPSDTTPQTGTFDIGSRFYVNADATCTGIMFYRESSDPLTSRTVRLWDDTSTQLASATTSGESGTGWVTGTFSSPVSLSKATYYRAVAEYHDHRFDGGGFLPLGSGPLWIPNDVFTSTLGAFPSSGGAGNVNYRYVSPLVVAT